MPIPGGPLLFGYEDGPGLGALEGADDALFLHLVHNSGGPGVAKLQSSLQHGDRGLSRFQNHIHGSGEHFVPFQLLFVGFDFRGGLAGLPGLLGLLFDLLQHLLVVVGYIVLLHIPGNGFHLSVGDKAALDTQGFAAANGCIEHIALAHQLFGALGIQDDPGLHGGGHGEGNSGGNIGLHQAGNHIGRGPLGGDNQVHTGSTAHLGNAADGILHLFGSHQHQICQLIDDDDHLGQLLPVLLGLHNAIVGFQIPHTGVAHQLIPAEHFRHGPLQRACRLLRVGDHGDEQMGNAIVNAQLYHFGVYHDELDILGPGLVQKADDNGIHAHGFTGAGGTGNEHVGHFGDIAHNAVACNILAHGEGGLPLGTGKLRRIDDLPQGNGGDGTVGHLNAHNGDFPGDGGNAHTGSAQAQCNIIGTGGELAQPHTLIQLHLVPGNAGATGDVDNMGIDVEACQGFVQAGGILPHFLGSVGADPGGAAQQINGREAIGALLPLGLALGNFLGHLTGRLLGLLAGDLAGLFLGLRLLLGGSRLPRRLYRFRLLPYKGGHFLGDRRFLQFLRLFPDRHAERNRLLSAVNGGIDIQADGIHHVRCLGRGAGIRPRL